MKSAHHTTHKNVGFGCSTNAKVILINIVSNELMTSSARDASSLQNTKNDGNMELRILQFKENIFHFPIWHALLLLVENERRKFNQLSVTSCSLNEISHLQRWQVVSFWHFPPNFQKLPAWKDSLLWHNSLLLEQVIADSAQTEYCPTFPYACVCQSQAWHLKFSW